MSIIYNQNADDLKDQEEEYLDKIAYLGGEMSKNLDPDQKSQWKRTISWYSLADYIKDKVRHYIEHRMKILDILIILLSGLGLITNGLQTLFYLKFTKVRENDGTFSIKIEGKSNNLIEALRCITSVSTLIVIILIITHYEIKKNFLIFKHEIPFNSSFCSKNLIIPMIIEIIFTLIHTPPFLNNVKINLSTTGANSEKVPIFLDLFISVFILGRVYLLCKFYANYSKWGDVFASRVCNECNANGGFIFTCKAGIKEHPFLSVIIVMVLTILICGYGLRNAEISFVKNIPEKYFQDWTEIANGFWFMTTNVLSIGYGDFYPTTLLGRIIAFIACLWGILLESLLVIAITNSLNLNVKEELAYNDVEKHLENAVYKKKALNLIYQFYNCNIICADQEKNTSAELRNNKFEERLQFHKKMYFNKSILKTKKALIEFRKMRKNKEKKEREISVQTLMTKINFSINENMDYLLRNIKNQINNLLENLNEAQEHQNKILLFSGILDVLHKSMYDKVKERAKINGQLIIDVHQDEKNKKKNENINLLYDNKEIIENDNESGDEKEEGKKNEKD